MFLGRDRWIRLTCWAEWCGRVNARPCAMWTQEQMRSGVNMWNCVLTWCEHRTADLSDPSARIGRLGAHFRKFYRTTCPCVATGQLNSFYQANGQKQSKGKSATEVGSIIILCPWYHIYIARVEPLSIIAIYKSKTHLQHKIKIIIHYCNLQEQNTSPTYLDKIHARQHSTTVFLKNYMFMSQI
jgi:hypothetical protein